MVNSASKDGSFIGRRPPLQSFCVFCFSEITLMESDILSDDFVETETFDLGTLEISKTCAKTFTFRKVESWVSFPAIPGFV